MLELSTPVVKLWDGILALPLIGTLDCARTQVVMESLLQKIVETGSQIAIIDITGVPTVDTLVAQHLLKTVTALRLMGADCIISGIRPQIAQTIVHLGVDLQGVTTKATLADALALALQAHRADGRRDRAREPWNAFRSCGWASSCSSPSRWTCTTSWRCTLQDDLTQRDRATAAPGRADRHLGAGDGRLLHRPHDRQHRRHGAHPRRAARWWSACSRRSPSRWSSWACRCRASRTALNVERGMELLQRRTRRGRRR